MTRISRARPLDARRLERRLHAEYHKTVEIPRRHIIGRLAAGTQAQLDTASPLGIYFNQEGLGLSLFDPFLAEVGYRPFRTRTEQDGLDKRSIADRINDLGGISIQAVTVQRTDLRLSRLTLSKRGVEAYLLLSYVDHALDKKGRDVTEQLYTHHDLLVTEFGNPDYVDPVLHFGVVTGHGGMGAGGWFEDYVPGELDSVIPERITLPPVSLVKLPRLPD